MDSKVIVGVAHLPARHNFFFKKVLPKLQGMADQVWVYTDGPSPDLVKHGPLGTGISECPHQSVGDAGKFF